MRKGNCNLKRRNLERTWACRMEEEEATNWLKSQTKRAFVILRDGKSIHWPLLTNNIPIPITPCQTTLEILVYPSPTTHIQIVALHQGNWIPDSSIFFCAPLTLPHDNEWILWYTSLLFPTIGSNIHTRPIDKTPIWFDHQLFHPVF